MDMLFAAFIAAVVTVWFTLVHLRNLKKREEKGRAAAEKANCFPAGRKPNIRISTLPTASVVEPAPWSARRVMCLPY